MIVQIIQTKWTKSSRGGEEATKRNSTPIVVALPKPSESPYGFLQHVTFDEMRNFEPLETLEVWDTDKIKREFPGVHLSRELDLLKVRFHWDFFPAGAPKRESRTLFRLQPGQYGRFIFNGRLGASLSSGREWSYFKYVYNILNAPGFSDDLGAKAPDILDEELADLL